MTGAPLPRLTASRPKLWDPSKRRHSSHDSSTISGAGRPRSAPCRELVIGRLLSSRRSTVEGTAASPRRRLGHRQRQLARAQTPWGLGGVSGSVAYPVLIARQRYEGRHASFPTANLIITLVGNAVNLRACSGATRQEANHHADVLVIQYAAALRSSVQQIPWKCLRPVPGGSIRMKAAIQKTG